ncbi:Uncharacterised protein [Enterobacter cloacae]|nr:Uncharacterised protein [Enterobacter cloacae]
MQRGAQPVRRKGDQQNKADVDNQHDDGKDEGKPLPFFDELPVVRTILYLLTNIVIHHRSLQR